MVAGAATGAALYLGEPLGVLLGMVALLLAIVSTVGRSRQAALPLFIWGAGMVGGLLTLALSGSATFAVNERGRSPVCSSAGGCPSTTVLHSSFEVPAWLLFGALVAVGGVWLLILQRRAGGTGPAG